MGARQAPATFLAHRGIGLRQVAPPNPGAAATTADIRLPQAGGGPGVTCLTEATNGLASVALPPRPCCIFASTRAFPESGAWHARRTCIFGRTKFALRGARPDIGRENLIA